MCHRDQRWALLGNQMQVGRRFTTMSRFQRTPDGPLRSRGYKVTLFFFCFSLAIMLWFVVKGCLLEGAY